MSQNVVHAKLLIMTQITGERNLQFICSSTESHNFHKKMLFNIGGTMTEHTPTNILSTSFHFMF